MFRLEREDGKLILQSIWGRNDQHQLLLSAVDQFVKEGTTYLYLENKLIIYSKMIVFDLQLASTSPTYRSQSRAECELPIELLSRTLAQIEVIYSQKQQQLAQRVQL